MAKSKVAVIDAETMKKSLRIAQLALFFSALSAPASGLADGRGAELNVEILNIESDEGQIGCSLWTSADGFPSKAKKARALLFVATKNRKATCTFKNLKPGVYAVSVMHDLDKDGKLATSVVGRPLEPWGVSNDVPAERFGPPKYRPANFELSGDGKTIRVKLQN